MGNQDQNQIQEIKVQKDGTWEDNYCPCYVDDLVQPLLNQRERIGASTAVGFSEPLRKLKQVKVLTYEGKVVKVQCFLNQKGLCQSEVNNNRNKPCHLLSS